MIDRQCTYETVGLRKLKFVRKIFKSTTTSIKHSDVSINSPCIT